MPTGWYKANIDRWEKGFTALSRFHAREGHCHPPRRHVEGKFKLGQWVSVQRYRVYHVPAERRRRLDAIGFVWDFKDYRWEQGFAVLLKFKRREGHCRAYRSSITKEITDLDGGFPHSAEIGKKCRPNGRRGSNLNHRIAIGRL